MSAMSAYTAASTMRKLGSNTKQGAMSTFLQDVLHRINGALGKTPEDYYQAVAGSFLVSCDNAHAVHPNHGEKTDAVNCSWMNKGIVIKESANQKYTTDAFSRAVFTNVCNEAGVPVQAFCKPQRQRRRFHTGQSVQYTGQRPCGRYRSSAAWYALLLRDSRCEGCGVCNQCSDQILSDQSSD